MKNVTGYDLVKLMAGSHGTLGVLTEVAFKLLPVPEASATLVLEGLSPEGAVAAMSAALGSPFEVTGAAHLPGDPARTLLRIEGFADAVAYRAERLSALLAAHAAPRVIDAPEEVAATWRAVRDVLPLAGVAGDVWRFSVAPSDGPAVLQALGDVPAVMDWGGGLVWAAVAEGSDARSALDGLAGHATLVRGSAATRARLPAFHPVPALAPFAAALRAKYDPRCILNPGVMEG
jgi:glycolate oxidase FAD binding subunit